MDTSLIPDLLILGWGLFNLFLLLVEKHSAGSKNEKKPEWHFLLWIGRLAAYNGNLHLQVYVILTDKKF